MQDINKNSYYVIRNFVTVTTKPIFGTYAYSFHYTSGNKISLRGSAVGRLLELQVRIPPESWMFAFCVLCSKGQKAKASTIRTKKHG
jgi:hypothetical protein